MQKKIQPTSRQQHVCCFHFFIDAYNNVYACMYPSIWPVHNLEIVIENSGGRQYKCRDAFPQPATRREGEKWLEEDREFRIENEASSRQRHEHIERGQEEK